MLGNQSNSHHPPTIKGTSFVTALGPTALQKTAASHSIVFYTFISIMTIKFSLPASAQYFTPFPRLPIELRLQIWEDAIYQPGMNFLRISYNSTASRRFRNSGPFPPIRKATLQPMYHHPEAEDSQFYNLNHVLENLSLACAESNRVVRRFKQHPNTIKLPDGRVVTALDSHDTICLDEYVPQNLFTSGCRILTDVNCFGLDRIRHVAIRYCYNWETKGPHCFECFRRHSVDTKKALPLHVYQFLVRHMPNLQTVYLIDFLILRRDTNDPAVTHSQSFRTLGPRICLTRHRATDVYIERSQVLRGGQPRAERVASLVTGLRGAGLGEAKLPSVLGPKYDDQMPPQGAGAGSIQGSVL